MARLPPLRWVLPRIVLGLLFIACVQLVAYMGIIPSAQQNAEICNCGSKVEVECPKGPNENTKNAELGNQKTVDDLTLTKLETNSELKSSDKRTLENTAELKKHTEQLNQIAKDLKQLALELIETQRESVTHATIFHRLSKHVSSVNTLLRSVHHSAVDNQNILDKKTVKKEPSKLKNLVCPETFLGKDLSFGYPWFRKGFETMNCTKFTPLSELITVVLHIHDILPKPAHDLQTIVHSIGKLYPGVRVVIGTGTNYPQLKDTTKVPLKVKTFDKNHQGQIWSELINEVVTPFVFAATDLTHFDDDINFVRLIRVLGNSDDIIVAGGSYRDLKGRWDIGCLQTSFRNWTMSFRGGYYRSADDCVACDYLAGPWVAKTKELKKLGFDKGLEFGVIHDLFWRLKKSIPGGIAVSCPDIMFNVHTYPTPDSSYVHLANKWAIKKWVDSDGHVRWYGCRRGYEHNLGTSACSMTKGLGNPPCDLENFADAIKFLMKECEDAGLFCELQEGTLLGAVKFNKVLPWERDADITFLTANYTAFKKLRNKFSEQGYTLSDDDESIWCCADGRQAGGKFTVGTSRFTIEMYGQHMMESELLVAKGQSPTKVQLAGQWVNVVRNPGLFARNRYGANIYRHAEHWMDLGQGTGWEFYHPGTFTTCPYPGHSACLDQYPSDGNIQFSDYVSR